MTPGQYIALARDIGFAVAIGLILWFVYRGGEDRVKAADLKGLQAQIQHQGEILAGWRKEATDANAQLSKDVAAINAAPPVQHVWLRNDCPEQRVLPATAGKAGNQSPSGGGLQSGPGEAAAADRRDGIVAGFKQKWELELAQCRALDAQWPH